MNKPKAKDYYTDCALHSAMQEYARTKDKYNLEATVTFEDGSVWVTELKRQGVDISYRTMDGEVYTVSANCGLFDDFTFGAPMSKAKAKQSLLAWIDAPYVAVKWRDIK